MKRDLAVAWLVLALGGCGVTPPAPPPRPSPAVAARCELGPPAEVLQVDEAAAGELHEVYDLPDAPSLWAQAPADGERERFRSAVSARLGGRIGPRELLERQRPIYAAMGAQGFAGEAENAAAVLEGRAGVIAGVSCLEALLWRRQAARFPMLQHPTEFGAFILRGQGRVRLYFSSADLVGQKIRAGVTDRVLADVSGGLELVAHLHNHPFLFDRTLGDRMWTIEATLDDVAGALAPSMTDVQLYRRLRESAGLQGAWITNGLDSIHISADDLDRLRAAE